MLVFTAPTWILRLVAVPRCPFACFSLLFFAKHTVRKWSFFLQNEQVLPMAGQVLLWCLDLSPHLRQEKCALSSRAVELSREALRPRSELWLVRREGWSPNLRFL